MPLKKAKTKTATEPKQDKKAQIKVNGLPLKDGVEKEFNNAIKVFTRQAKRKAFLGNALMYAPFIALMLLIFVTLNGWLFGVITTVVAIIVGQLIGKFMNWATNMAVKGEGELRHINHLADNKSDIVNMLAKEIADKKVKNSKK